MVVVDFTPALSDVGALLHARTRDARGAELGTFTVDTRPSAAAAQLVVAQAVRGVKAITGVVDDTWPSVLVDDAGALATLSAALMIEASFYPEEVKSGASPFTAYQAIYRDQLAAFKAAIEEWRVGGEVGPEDDRSGGERPGFYMGDAWEAQVPGGLPGTIGVAPVFPGQYIGPPRLAPGQFPPAPWPIGPWLPYGYLS